MNINSATTLKAVLGGAIATTNPTVQVTYFDVNLNGEQTKPATYKISLNGTNDVTILAAPPAAVVRVVQAVDVYNADTAVVTVSVKTDDGTQRVIAKANIDPGDTLCYR